MKTRAGDKPRECAKPPVVVTTGAESATFSLSKCDGSAASGAVDQLSLLARPPEARRPKDPLESLARNAGPDLAPGIRRVDPGLVARLEHVVDHFRKDGETARVVLVSGYRPRSARSYHQLGRALDFRLEGVTNEALVAFCRTLPDTGCGYYPNSFFVHMDVRNPGAGHVTWIDVSRPGESPRYVSQWPLPPSSLLVAAPVGTLPALPAPDRETEVPAQAPSASRHPYFF